MERDEAIKRIKAALKQRSGKAWSVVGGRGTSWGWIHVQSVPSRRVDGGMTTADANELAALLGIHPWQCRDDYSIPAGYDFRRAAVERAETGDSSIKPEIYWD